MKPGATVYPVDENANSDVEAVSDEYDDFVFLNGNTCAEALSMLKAKGKNVYAFDVYEEFLDELIAGNTHFKGIMAQNTFGMTRKATLTKDGEVIFSYGPFLEHFTKSDVDNAETNEGLWEVYFTSDDPEFESPEPTRELYRADGTCTFYELVDEQWVEDKEVTNSEYFIDGPMFFIRWQESEEMMYENWEVVSSENGKQVNKSVRKHDDGSTYTIYANLTKVE